MFASQTNDCLQIGDLTLTRKLFITVKEHSAFLIAAYQNKKIIVTLDDSSDTAIRGLFHAKKSTKFAEIAKLLISLDCVEAKEIATLITAEVQKLKVKPEHSCCRLS